LNISTDSLKSTRCRIGSQWRTSRVVSISRNTCSYSSVTISRSSSSFSLKITNRSFYFASPHLWNQLPVSFRQSPSHSPHFTHGSSCHHHYIPFLTPLFHCRLKTYTFSQVFPTISGTVPPDCLLGLLFGLISLIGLFYFHIPVITF